MTSDATRIATNFSQTVLENFLRDGTIREKYNVVSGSANVDVATGYKSNVVGFGWTNGAYLQMSRLLAADARRRAAAALYHGFDPEPVAYQSRISFRSSRQNAAPRVRRVLASRDVRERLPTR